MIMMSMTLDWTVLMMNLKTVAKLWVKLSILRQQKEKSCTKKASICCSSFNSWPRQRRNKVVTNKSMMILYKAQKKLEMTRKSIYQHLYVFHFLSKIRIWTTKFWADKPRRQIIMPTIQILIWTKLLINKISCHKWMEQTCKLRIIWLRRRWGGTRVTAEETYSKWQTWPRKVTNKSKYQLNNREEWSLLLKTLK